MSDRNILDCDSVAPYLSVFADGELAEPLRAEVAAHASVCETCAAQLDRIRAIDRLLAGLPRTAPSAGVYARTLAAATRHAPPEPRVITRETLPGGKAEDARQRISAFIASESSESDDGSRGPAPRRSRAPWVAAAIPLVAALLLIALSATLFNRFSGQGRQLTTTHPTPSAASSLAQTRVAVGAVASQLAFKPVVPTWLPAGASSPTVRVGPAEQVQANSRYLDITWTFSSGPAQSLHLRELPVGLDFYGYAPASGSTATMAWSLPNHAGWEALSSLSCARCLAVGETHADAQLALDARPRASASATAVEAWLRLVSLSLDASYKPLGVPLTPPDSALALRYIATVSDAQGQSWQWVVTIVGALGAQQLAHTTGNGRDVTEITSGGSSVRLDNLRHLYQPLTSLQPTAQPPSAVTQTFFAASEFVATGELWNLGESRIKLLDGRWLNVYDLYRVNATQPEHIYADAATGQVIELLVSTPNNARPGGLAGSQTYVSTTACPPYTVTYTTIEYAPTSELPPAYFSTTQKSGWMSGSVTPAFTCQP